MDIILSFMDKLYGDSKTLSIVYVVGAVLLFVFILLLIISLRKSTKNETTKIIDEPKINDESKEKLKTTNVELTEEHVVPIEETENSYKKEEQSLEQSIFEKTTIIPLNELEAPISRKENIAQALENVENKAEETIIEKSTEETLKELSSDIPSVDDFVDNVVKKTYEKNEQFSSVYVGNNTNTIKLDKVMENLNVDEDVKKSIVPEEEKTVVSTNDILNKEEIEMPCVVSNKEEVIETPKILETAVENTISLDGLKKALEEKQKDISISQDDLKTKLNNLKKEEIKSNETIKAEDLLNKLNSMKEK